MQSSDRNAQNMIRTLEVVLIQSLSPRQNKRRGDDFSGIEHIQALDPEIELKHKRLMLSELYDHYRQGS
ncbi:MAG TPA: hypothetical protein VKB53_11440 [Gammaproteobacteria bacterium]|nr:hypothetical protein [Gammaproteobacteria bacterium]